MAKEFSIDFKGNDPVASSGARFARVPEGTYHVAVRKPEIFQTANDKPAIRATIEITKGDYKGKQVGEMFVLPRKGTDDSTFGVQRLHGLMVACGIKKQEKAVGAGAVCKTLTNKECITEIADDEMPASGDRAARPISRPFAYYAVGSKEAKAKLGGGGKASKKSKASDDDDEDEDEEEKDEEEESDDEDEDSDDEDDDDLLDEDDD